MKLTTYFPISQNASTRGFGPHAAAVVFAGAISLQSCASSGPDAASAPATSPGQQCLSDAGAPRSVPAQAPDRISVAHILVRHAALSDPKGATRTREEACLTALHALDDLQSGASWGATVNKYSDSGQSTRGELGQVAREELTGSFGDAAFALDVDELSYVVESDRGFHIILRTR